MPDLVGNHIVGFPKRWLICHSDYANDIFPGCSSSSLPEVPNGRYKASGYSFSDTASLVCNPGHSPVSAGKPEPQCHCQGNGRWSSSTATCEAGIKSFNPYLTDGFSHRYHLGESTLS